MRKLAMAFGCSWRAAALGVLAAWACAPSGLRAQESQGVYKSVDANGHVVYSDRGGSKSAAKTSIRVEEGNPAEAARLSKEQQSLTAADAERRKQQAADDKAHAAAEKKKEETCRNARNEYNRLDTRAPFRRDADGNRLYYTDPELDALRAQARAAMKANCAS